MAIRLIVNADDYGRTPQVSRGIRQAHSQGIVTSTTAMMNMPGVEADLQLAARETPHLGIGVHLVLTCGAPLLPANKVASLVDKEGSFLALRQIEARAASLDPEQAGAEWRAQVEKFIHATGKVPTHLDSHHHSSYFTEPLFRAMLELAREYGSAIRLGVVPGEHTGLPETLANPAWEFVPRLLAEFRPRTTQFFNGNFYDETATRQDLLAILANLQEGSTELMTHPGYVDEELLQGSGYAVQRLGELDILTDPEVIAAVRERGIQLISFAGL